mmetsp:Transcript_54239/g.117277  ORF Transcript_54239/g.117277 Transcript_54239/m.117277 type:complete len:215 (-) Transcript_54239:1229-1873(-)
MFRAFSPCVVGACVPPCCWRPRWLRPRGRGLWPLRCGHCGVCLANLPTHVLRTEPITTFAFTGDGSPSRAAEVAEPRGRVLLGFDEEVPQLRKKATLLVHKCDGHPLPACAASTADTVHVVVQLLWHVKIHHKCHVRDIETSCSNVSGDKDWVGACFEGMQSLLALLLRPIAMNCCYPQSCLVQLELQCVSCPLRLNEDNCETVLRQAFPDSLV